MHIAFLTPEYPHTNLKHSAGLGTSIKNLARGLIQEGVNVTVFVVFQNKNITFYDKDIKIISIARKGYKLFGWYLERKHIQTIIQQEIDATNINIIEAPDWTGITAFMKFPVPIVIRLHGSDGYFCYLEKRKQKFKHYFFEKNALKRSNKIVSVSTFTANLTKKIFNLNCSIETIHNGIDTEDFKPIPTEINHGQLLYFGTIIKKKGVLELAQIFNAVVEKNNKATLLLIGKDVHDVFENTSTITLFNQLLTEKAKQKVTYIPEVSYQDIKNYIAKANIIVLPSFAEAFPMTWLETLAMEKPLVASNIGWANELMIDGKTGYTVEPTNHKKYAQRILTLLEDKDKVKVFGKEAREHVICNFSTTVIIKKNINLYESLLDQND
ncbi:MAG: glycosyltransferase family 4 protein [Flavobacteriaceae bacterium]|nr:glycosyltransferase family 4 protein [Flavobacteriaceae bacterium]